MAVEFGEIKVVRETGGSRILGITVLVTGLSRPGSIVELQGARIDGIKSKAYKWAVATVQADGTALFDVPVSDHSPTWHSGLQYSDTTALRVVRSGFEGYETRVEAVRPTIYPHLQNWLWKLFHPGWADRDKNYYSPFVQVVELVYR